MTKSYEQARRHHLLLGALGGAVVAVGITVAIIAGSSSESSSPGAITSKCKGQIVRGYCIAPGSNLTGANLRGANLRGGKLQGHDDRQGELVVRGLDRRAVRHDYRRAEWLADELGASQGLSDRAGSQSHRGKVGRCEFEWS